MGKSNPKRKKASKNSAAKTANRCAKDLAVVWIGERHNTQHKRAQVGQKQMRAPKFLLLPRCQGNRGAGREPGRPIPVDSPFRRNFMSGALTVVPGVHLSDFCARAKCLFERGKVRDGRPGLTGEMFFDRDGFNISFFLLLFIPFKFYNWWKKVFGGVRLVFRGRCHCINFLTFNKFQSCKTLLEILKILILSDPNFFSILRTKLALH